jgi:hypothetical protein
MQILQSIGEAKGWPNVKMQRCMSQKREVNQQHSTMQFLKRDRNIHCYRRGTGSALGIGDNEDSVP